MIRGMAGNLSKAKKGDREERGIGIVPFPREEKKREEKENICV